MSESESKNYWKSKVSNALHYEKRGLKSFPAVKIGKLAVNLNYQGKGIGEQIINWVKASFTTDNKTGCLFIIVDAINRPNTIKFYKKCNFTFLSTKDEKDKTRLMYYCLLEN